ncbi:GNAT family N-acetyltransferase [Streptomyces asoensis]|uniref:Acetyltransferase n=1 Tax=Streptomyces asoensis TaxID=249586 RepID=A0ABQ3S8S8_9ACTN|nr:GNAT family N-acetyltransferase [Streptomyces asoensis]GGQ84113.1 acetyltransferase [Streptomyces asoensis]GHI64352.1 acetyltransferase [Streptomyces asoensis]
MPHTASRHLAEGPRVGIRHFTYEDGPEFTARAWESQDLHRPWLFPPVTADAYTAYAGRLIEDPSKAGFLVCTLEDGAVAGFVNINNIVQGGFQCGALGYGVFAHAAGRGLMREALGLVVDHAFTAMRLHRLEINAQPGNTASIALARSCGFRLEGFSPKMIHIDGEWRDHERWAITAEMRA